MQERPPARVMLKIFSHMFGEQNMSRITTIHHTLRDIDARPSNVCMFVDIGYFTHRSAMNSHSDREWQRHPSYMACAYSRRGDIRKARGDRAGAIADYEHAVKYAQLDEDK